jgi:hypothetical protein
LIAHQTIQRSATIGSFKAIASHTMPQALPLMRTIVPGIAMGQQPHGIGGETATGRVVLSDDAKFAREADDSPPSSAYGGAQKHGVTPQT